MEHGEAEPIKAISVTDLKTRIDGGGWLVDVRSAEEYRHLHATAVRCVIPHTDVASSLGRLPADKRTPIYLICRTGSRSCKVARLLADLGFSEVYNVSGGMMAWMEQGYPTESGPGILDHSS